MSNTSEVDAAMPDRSAPHYVAEAIGALDTGLKKQRETRMALQDKMASDPLGTSTVWMDDVRRADDEVASAKRNLVNEFCRRRGDELVAMIRGAAGASPAPPVEGAKVLVDYYEYARKYAGQYPPGYADSLPAEVE